MISFITRWCNFNLAATLTKQPHINPIVFSVKIKSLVADQAVLKQDGGGGEASGVATCMDSSV